jgi:hypothetical protein
MRKRYLESTLPAETDDDKDDVESIAVPESSEISRASLEDDARHTSLHGVDPADRFWMHQHGWAESAKIGAGIIQAQPVKGSTKKQQ